MKAQTFMNVFFALLIVGISAILSNSIERIDKNEESMQEIQRWTKGQENVSNLHRGLIEGVMDGEESLRKLIKLKHQ